MKKIIGVILILLSLYLGYVGVTKYTNSGESVDIVGIELSAKDNQQETTSFIYLGFALLSFIGGIVLVRNKKA
jgi:LPXTG-motif cell wall-anchored protein